MFQSCSQIQEVCLGTNTSFSRTYDSSVKNFTQTTSLSALRIHNDESPKCLKSFGFQTLPEKI